MSIPDELLSFRNDGVHKYHLSDDHDGRRVWSNSLGWEIRHVTPASPCQGGSMFRMKKMWRYDVHEPGGRLVGSEPTFWEASRNLLPRLHEPLNLPSRAPHLHNSYLSP